MAKALRYTILVSCLSLSFFLYFKYHRGVQISFVNQSAERLEDISVDYAGGNFVIPVLEQGQVLRIKIQPIFESGCTITFNSRGLTYSHSLGVYWESRGSYDLHVDIFDKGKIAYGQKYGLTESVIAEVIRYSEIKSKSAQSHPN